jgi:F0F1-type ATP synthase delta subunit
MTDIEKLANVLYTRITTIGTTHDVVNISKKILEKYNKEKLLLPVLKKLQYKFTQDSNSEQIVIETPFVLSEAATQSISSRITGEAKSTKVKQIEKPELLAGFRAIHKGTLYDASARKYINELKKL